MGAAKTAVVALSLILTLSPAAEAQDSDRCPGTALDRGPALLTDLEPFKRAVRATEYSGRVVLQLKVTEKGEMRDLEIKFPPRLASVSKVVDEIRAWRFCPGVRFSRYHESTMEFTIEIQNK